MRGRISSTIHTMETMWKCPKCSEEIEDTFDSCWNCQTERPGQLPQPVAGDDTTGGVPRSDRPTAPPPLSSPTARKNSGCCGIASLGIILLGTTIVLLAVWEAAKKSDKDGLDADTKPVDSHSAGGRSPESTMGNGRKSRPIKEPKPVPKESAELYLRDATELAATLDSLLEMANSGAMTVEGLGKAEEWKSNVASLLRQMKEDGFDIGPLNSATATGRVHAALESMQFAWESFGKFVAADSEKDRRTYSMMHASHLKFVRNNLSDAATWMERGKF